MYDSIYILISWHEEGHFNHLHLLEEIGQGSFGVVHKAIWRGKIVAAKVVRAEAGTNAHKTILSEMEAIRHDQYSEARRHISLLIIGNNLFLYRSINHPNILSLIGAMTVNNGPTIALITNYVRGHNLFYMIFNDEVQVKAVIIMLMCHA